MVLLWRLSENGTQKKIMVDHRLPPKTIAMFVQYPQLK